MPRGVYIRTEEHLKYMSESQRNKPKSEVHKKHLSEAMKGKPPWNKGLKGFNSNYPRNEDWCRKISESQKGIEKPQFRKENHPRWKGGDYNWCYTEARRLFGKSICELCGMTDQESLLMFGERLSLHCSSDPKDYHAMIPENWITTCHYCHTVKLDANGRKIYKRWG